MTEAGEIQRPKLTIIDRLWRLWSKASEDERSAFRAKIDGA
jgi:hypothetical protein